MPLAPDNDETTWHAIPEFVMLARLKSGFWRARVGLWSFARKKSWANGGMPRVWPSLATLALRVGEPVSTLRHQLRQLAEQGWIRRADDGHIELARERPFEVTSQVEFNWADPVDSTANESTHRPSLSDPRTRCAAVQHVDGPPPLGDPSRSGCPPVAREVSTGGHQTDQEQSKEQSMEPPVTVVPPVQDRITVEAELLRIVVKHGTGGLAPGPSFVGAAVRAVLEGKCTTEQVELICVEHKRRKQAGDKALRSWPGLFYDSVWYSTARDYLGIKPEGKGKRGGSKASLSATDAYWEQPRALRVVEPPPAEDDLPTQNWQDLAMARRQ